MAYINRAVGEIRRLGLLDSKRVTLAKHYVIERNEANVLGAGGYGAIWKGVDEKINEAVAVKQVQFNDKTKTFLERELKILKDCRHKHIVQLHEHDTDGHSVYFILELCDDNLDQFVKDRDIGFSMCLNCMIEICNGVEYLHSKRIAHRDLKPANVLVKDNVLKVADFGLSKAICDSFSPHSATRVGTQGWMAPELCTVEGTLKDDVSVDVFSLALLFHSLLVYQRGNKLTPHTGMQFLIYLFIYFLNIIHISGNLQ